MRKKAAKAGVDIELGDFVKPFVTSQRADFQE